jgi:peptidylprolyl isomerase
LPPFPLRFTLAIPYDKVVVVFCHGHGLDYLREKSAIHGHIQNFRHLAGLVLLTVTIGAVAVACGDASNSQEEGRVAAVGDTVSVHYRGTLDNGDEFDSSHGREPLTFEVGSGQVIPGFDEAVRGLQVGQSTTTRMDAEQAYGERREDLVFEVPRANAPSDLEAGDHVELSNGAPAVILEVTSDVVVVDANHELAGKRLHFSVHVRQVRRATREEVTHGHAHAPGHQHH